MEKNPRWLSLMCGMVLICAMSISTGCAFLIPRSYTAEAEARLAERPTIQFFANYPKGTSELPDQSQVVAIKFYDWGAGKYEILDAQSVPAKGARIGYPLRLYWAVVIPCLWTVSYDPYPGVVTFAKGCWPTCADLKTDTIAFCKATDFGHYKFRLIYWPRSFVYEECIASGAGLEHQYSPLTSLLRDQPDKLIECIEMSKGISPEQRGMVLRQLLDLLETCHRCKRLDDSIAYERLVMKIEQAVTRVAASLPVSG